MSARTHAGSTTALAIRDAIVDALSDLGLAHDAPSRQLLVRLISEQLEQPLSIADHSIGRNHLIELVGACVLTTQAMHALVGAVELMSPRSSISVRVRQLVWEPRVQDLMPPSDLEILRGLLTDLDVPHLPTLVRRATGPAVIPPAEITTVWRTFRYLTELNAGPTGVPPALLLLEQVAGQLGGRLAEQLREWAAQQAERMRRSDELLKYRSTVTPVAADARLHLLVLIEHDGIDPDLWQLSHWRQDDPELWPPPLGGTELVRSSELELKTDELVVRAEQAWAGHSGTVALEFVLPRQLLNLPVHRWRAEHDSGLPTLLGVNYPVVVRSLERMRSPHWHRKWRLRWAKLLDDPVPGVHVGDVADVAEPDRIDAILNDQRWTMMVLSGPPSDRPQSVSDELVTALRQGLPALVWHPSEQPAAVHEIVLSLIGEAGWPSYLPQHVREQRSRQIIHGTDAGIFADLVLLYDDPFRLIVDDVTLGHGERG